MSYYIIDTNIFIRHLTGDDPVKSPQCFEIIKKLASGEIEARICEAVICEICYVLSSKALGYKLTHREIRDRLSPLITLKGLILNDKVLYLNALNVFAENNHLDFEDALNISYMHYEDIKTIISYDSDFDSIQEVDRQEPAQVLDSIY